MKFVNQKSKIIRQLLIVNCSLFIAFAVTSCKKDKEKDVEVSSVTLNKTALTLVEGAGERLTATVQPAGATDKEVSWSASPQSVATVDASGNVTAVSAGSAVVTVTTRSGGKTATCDVTVNAATVAVTGIAITPAADVSVEAGKTVTLSAIVSPDNATVKGVTWSSLHTAISTVNAQSGEVTGISAGAATIRATAADGSGVTADKTVTVTAATEKSVSVGTPSGTMTVGEAGTVTYTVITTLIDNGTYPANIPSLPGGVTIAGGEVTIADNTGTLTLTGTPTVHGFFNTLRLTIDGTQSGTFTLSISEAETVTVNPNPELPEDFGDENL
jgi:hypothetical protein